MLSLILISLAPSFVPFLGTANAAPIERLEASVNSSLILSSDIKKFRDTLPLRTQLDPLFSGTVLASQGEKASSADIVQFLIDEALIAQQFQVSDSEVEQEINSIQANNKIDRNSLKSALKDQGFPFESYFELIRISTSKRNLIDRDIRTKVTISDDDLKNYFYNHYARKNEVPSAYKVRILTVTPSRYKNAKAAREVIDRALKEIKKGEPFADAATRISDDGSAQSGGDLGTLSADQMSPLILTELKKMKVGEVSGVLGTPKSRFFILKLEDVRSSETERFEKMKDEIRGKLASTEYQHQIQLWQERVRQGAFIHRARPF
jgi:peptidyl-prolyl cis-trans isomerase SurA